LVVSLRKAKRHAFEFGVRVRLCHTDGAKLNMTSLSVCRSTKSQTVSTLALTDILFARRDISGETDCIYIYIYISPFHRAF